MKLLKMETNNLSLADIAYKKDIESIKDVDNIISNVRGVYYKRKDMKNSKKHIGLIAQEVNKVLPEVIQDKNGIKYIDNGSMIALLVECIKKNNEEIKTLKNEISLLKTLI